MEKCRCSEYQEAVNKFHFFLPGTLHHLIPRRTVPDGYCVRWISSELPPILVKDKSEEIEETEKIDIEIDTKWIPVLPGLISQKLVNQNKPAKRTIFG